MYTLGNSCGRFPRHLHHVNTSSSKTCHVTPKSLLHSFVIVFDICVVILYPYMNSLFGITFCFKSPGLSNVFFFNTYYIKVFFSVPPVYVCTNPIRNQTGSDTLKPNRKHLFRTVELVSVTRATMRIFASTLLYVPNQTKNFKYQPGKVLPLLYDTRMEFYIYDANFPLI